MVNLTGQDAHSDESDSRVAIVVLDKVAALRVVTKDAPGEAV